MFGDVSRQKDKRDKEDEETVVLSPFEVTGIGGGGYFATSTLAGSRMNLGITPGGLQNLAYARDLLKNGMMPLPGEVTAEGLFSEHDLPVSAAPATRLIEIAGAAMPAQLAGNANITSLAQIGFSSSLRFDTFHRDPIFLNIVLDVSGSMGPYFDLVKDSVRALLGELHEGDAVSLVTFSTDARIELTPRMFDRANWQDVLAKVDQFQIRGGTNIEWGLKYGFEMAANRPAGFSGRSRVVLITDAMPNVDATLPGAFMEMATNASLAGVGLTTIGLNVQFNADFVRKVSSVSGGNAFWFANADDMRKKISDDFDFMTTEVAFDLEVKVTPAPGFKIETVYGVPDDVFAKTPDGGVVMDVPTLFLSREKGAIFLGLSGGPATPGANAGRVDLSYTVFGSNNIERQSFPLSVADAASAPLGLKRGLCLVAEVEALKAAGQAFYASNRIGEARRLVQSALAQFSAAGDAELAKERSLVEGLDAFLAAAEIEPPITDEIAVEKEGATPLIGVWSAREKGAPRASRLAFLPDGKVVKISENEFGWNLNETTWDSEGVTAPGGDKLKFAVDRKGLYLDGDDGDIRLSRISASGESDMTVAADWTVRPTDYLTRARRR